MAGPSTEMTASARPRDGRERRRRERSRNPFAIALRVSAWMVLLAALVAGVAVLLFIHRGDAEGSGRTANRELEFLLEPGETIERRAPVVQRNWWDYFRVTHGVLASTDRRLLFIGVPPTELLPREEEPLALGQEIFPYDRLLEVRNARVFLGTLPGIVITGPLGERTFGVSSRERGKLAAVLATVERRQGTLRTMAETERAAALAAAEAARRPVYHVVQRGEALELIAARYAVTIEQLRAWNAMQRDVIRAGQPLLVKPRT